MTTIRRIVAATWLLAALLAAGCSAPGPEPEVDEAAIASTIRAYLPRLAAAYATGNLEPLKELAVEKEIAHVRQRVSELTDQGKVYEPELREMTVESVSVWQYANAFVTTVEVWDVRSYALGSRTLLSETVDQRNQVKYQLKRKDDGWKILYRELADAPGG
jgi:hypothetical protein